MTKIAIIGASGLVGQTFIELLEKNSIEYDDLYLFGSQRSEGKKVQVNKQYYKIEKLTSNIPNDIDIAFFSAGSAVSRDFIPVFSEKGTVCIDNSSAFRMEDDVPLLVPEINMNTLRKNQKIIANPNCSTIQLVLVLHFLRQLYEIKRVNVISCQSVSGAGRYALETLHSEMKGNKENSVFHNNIIQHIGEIRKDGYCFEEYKIINETRKILGCRDLEITATTFRVPVDYCHTESVSIDFGQIIDIDRIKMALQSSELPIRFVYDVTNDIVKHSDTVFVSRIRHDCFRENILHLTITADNIHIGAATNAAKIAEEII